MTPNISFFLFYHIALYLSIAQIITALRVNKLKARYPQITYSVVPAYMQDGKTAGRYGDDTIKTPAKHNSLVGVFPAETEGFEPSSPVKG